MALASLAIPVIFALGARFRSFTVVTPSAYLSTPYVTSKYHLPAVRFLRDAELEGRLYSIYHLGGFLGYWLGPRLRTFVDGRNEAVAPDALLDMSRVQLRQGAPDESYVDVLDRREVDVLPGAGLKGCPAGFRFSAPSSISAPTRRREPASGQLAEYARRRRTSEPWEAAAAVDRMPLLDSREAMQRLGGRFHRHQAIRWRAREVGAEP